MPVTVTETAAREINSIVKQQGLDPDKIRLRVGVKGGGCSGFSYLLDLTETQKDSDEVWVYEFVPSESANASASEGGSAEGDGATAVATGGEAVKVSVICDPKSYLYLNGTEIDFKEEIMGRGFVFNNPNANSTCGCGSSFGA